MIKIDPQGDFAIDTAGHLTETTVPQQQNYISECRCQQGTYTPLPEFGLNPLVWTLSQSIKDKISDLTRIGQKYIVVRSISFENGMFNIQ